MFGLLMPANLFTYATTDLTYVENVTATVDIPELQVSNMSRSMMVRNNTDTSISGELADIVGIENEDTYALIYSEELIEHNTIYKSNMTDDELTEQFKNLSSVESVNINNTEIVEIDSTNKVEDTSVILDGAIEANSIIIEDKSIPKENTRNTEEVLVYANVDQTDALLETESPDENYTGAIVVLDPEDRDLLERLVQGEAGAEGYEGACLVAQAIRDSMIYKGYTSVADVRTACKYSGSISKQPNDNVKKACAFIFDEGGIAVKHKIFYFYAHKKIDSSFHESQMFIIEFGGHRFFSTWD